MTNYVPCKQDNKRVFEYRWDQERCFHDYLQIQRKTNPRYYGIRCHLKIDYVTFSVYLGPKKSGIRDERQLQPLINDLLNHKTESPRYRRNRHIYDASTTYRFINDGKKYELNIACASKHKLRPYLIKVHDPTKEVLRHLQQFLNLVTCYHINSIESTYDFYSEDNDLVRNFIKRHVVISWREKKGFHPEYEKTFYGNNIRLARGKGLRSYEKEDEKNGCQEAFVRLEMVLKRSILKGKEIHDIDDMMEMDSRIPNKYFSFKSYNYNKLRKRVADSPNWKGMFNELKCKIQNEINEGYLYEINKHSLNWHKRYYSDSYLKVTNYWKHFNDQFGTSSFLNGDSFVLSLQLMQDDF